MDGSIISESNLPTVDVVIILISFLLSLYSSGLMIIYWANDSGHLIIIPCNPLMVHRKKLPLKFMQDFDGGRGRKYQKNNVYYYMDF
jgi:hypothetical protein